MEFKKSDPLVSSGAEQQRMLFEAMCQLASGHQSDVVVGAALNVLINALRQSHSTRKGAMDRLDALTAKARELLANNYDLTGKRRNGVFPFAQRIELPLIRFPKEK